MTRGPAIYQPEIPSRGLEGLTYMSYVAARSRTGSYAPIDSEPSSSSLGDPSGRGGFGTTSVTGLGAPEAFVQELQLCVPVKAEIKQIDLNAETAAKSSKLFYYLTQSLAKWERGIELLRPAQRDKDRVPAARGDSDDHLSAASSRLEAVFVREQALKL